MTPLARHLRRLIAADGPIPLSRFMAEALGHPAYGYYMRGDPLGAAGDFVTAPEVSQMFGELIGLWCADVWQAMGEPARVVLAELGPGRGTLMADALRAARALPGFAAAIEVHLVESSPALRARQRERLTAHRPTWHESVASLPRGPLLLIANEFFDALPLRQFQRGPAGWHERLVAATPDGFGFVLAPEALPAAAAPAAPDAPLGATIEVAPAREALMAELAARLLADGGAALIVDYGHDAAGIGDTLQAVRRHAPAEALADPGEADLTAHVDFGALARAARAAGAVVHGPLGQGTFLEALGLETRAARLAAGAAPEAVEAVHAAVARLAAPEAMGSLFKAMAVAAPGLPTPAGFEAAP